MSTSLDRRPVGLRELRPVRILAGMLARAGLRPNHVSVLGVGFSALTAACLLRAETSAEPIWRSLLFLAAAGFIPLRGLCNLCDGLMAIDWLCCNEGYHREYHRWPRVHWTARPALGVDARG